MLHIIHISAFVKKPWSISSYLNHEECHIVLTISLFHTYIASFRPFKHFRLQTLKIWTYLWQGKPGSMHPPSQSITANESHNTSRSLRAYKQGFKSILAQDIVPKLVYKWISPFVPTTFIWNRYEKECPNVTTDEASAFDVVQISNLNCSRSMLWTIRTREMRDFTKSYAYWLKVKSKPGLFIHAKNANFHNFNLLEKHQHL
jgi:hypothetical protein